MQALQKGVPSDLHGIQVGVGTLLVLWIYENILNFDQVDQQKAQDAMKRFSQEKWEKRMRQIFGPIAPSILQIEEKTGKNLPETQKKHLETIVLHWNEIRGIIQEELPSKDSIYDLMASCHMPLSPADLGLTRDDTVSALLGSREIRNKYLTSSLLWDLGLLGETAEKLPCD